MADNAVYIENLVNNVVPGMSHHIYIPPEDAVQYRLNFINYCNITVNANILGLDADKKSKFFKMIETYADILNEMPHQGAPMYDYILHNDEHHTVKQWDTNEPEDYYLCPIVKQFKIWKETGAVQVEDHHTPINQRDIVEYKTKSEDELVAYQRDVNHYLRFQFCYDLTKLSPEDLHRAFTMILNYSDILETVFGTGIPIVDYELYGNPFKTITETIPLTDEEINASLPLVDEYATWKNSQ